MSMTSLFGHQGLKLELALGWSIVFSGSFSIYKGVKNHLKQSNSMLKLFKL